MNKTKIIATIGPASSDKEVLRELMRNGMDVIRLNMSHASYPFCKDIIKKVQSLNEELHTNVGIMLDTKGPQVRLGSFSGGKALLKAHDKIRIYMYDILGDNTKFSVDYPGLSEEVKIGTIIKLDDGKIDLQVLEKGATYLICEVLNDGVIENGKGVNIPGLHLNLPFLSTKDKDDIYFAIKYGVDFLALSFVRSAEDILEVNDLLIDMGNDHIGIIAKIENESALEELDEIIRLADGVIVARGDLGVEIPMEKVPSVQKSIIQKCHSAGKLSVVATELLSSMEHDVRPTRAEVSDVANAVIDSVDAVMLSGETTIGSYPVETLKMMEKIMASAEEDIHYTDLLDKAIRTEKQDITGLICYSVSECANRLHAKAIVCPTISGYTARKISRFRPSCPILVVSPNPHTVRSLSLHFGIHATLIDELNSLDRIIKISTNIARKELAVDHGDKIIITGGYPFKEVKHTNFMKIEEL